MGIQIRRGDVFYADLNPAIGSEQGGIRPVLVIQNNLGNQFSPTVLIAPITSKVSKKANLPTHCKIESDFLEFDSMVLLEQIRTKYSVGNALLILAQKPDASQLKDYDGWKEKGTGVKPKEKGIIILEPGNEYVREDGTTAVSYNAKKVFDVSQTFTREKAKPQVKRNV